MDLLADSKSTPAPFVASHIDIEIDCGVKNCARRERETR
jgi:hypothetical protein